MSHIHQIHTVVALTFIVNASEFSSSSPTISFADRSNRFLDPNVRFTIFKVWLYSANIFDWRPLSLITCFSVSSRTTSGSVVDSLSFWWLTYTSGREDCDLVDMLFSFVIFSTFSGAAVVTFTWDAFVTGILDWMEFCKLSAFRVNEELNFFAVLLKQKKKRFCDKNAGKKVSVGLTQKYGSTVRLS